MRLVLVTVSMWVVRVVETVNERVVRAVRSELSAHCACYQHTFCRMPAMKPVCIMIVGQGRAVSIGNDVNNFQARG